MKKVYARQIPPECQESPLSYGTEFWPEDIAFFGNRYYMDHLPGIFENLETGMQRALEEWDDMQLGHPFYDGWADCLETELPPVGRGQYTRDERLKWPKILINYYRKPNAANIARIASMITGKEYRAGTICGACQGDWQDIVYPAEYGRKWLAAFESEYFNTGTEWIIHDADEPPESPDDISGYSLYCTGDPRAEIAAETGVPPSAVVLYEFDGWVQTAKYKASGGDTI